MAFGCFQQVLHKIISMFSLSALWLGWSAYTLSCLLAHGYAKSRLLRVSTLQNMPVLIYVTRNTGVFKNCQYPNEVTCESDKSTAGCALDLWCWWSQQWMENCNLTAWILQPCSETFYRDVGPLSVHEWRASLLLLPFVIKYNCYKNWYDLPRFTF